MNRAVSSKDLSKLRTYSDIAEVRARQLMSGIVVTKTAAQLALDKERIRKRRVIEDLAFDRAQGSDELYNSICRLESNGTEVDL